MSGQVRCSGCGSSMTPTSDGRKHACPYCGAEVQVAIDSGQIATGLALDLTNAKVFLTQLANALHGSIGERTRVERDGEHVTRFEVNLDPDVFIAKKEAGAIVAQHKKMVRGIALKTQTHPLDHWVELLTKALASHANESARVAEVLTTLRGG